MRGCYLSQSLRYAYVIVGGYNNQYCSIRYHVLVYISPQKIKRRKTCKIFQATVEIIWTAIPLLIIIGLAMPATKLLIEMDDTSDTALTVKAVGYQ